MLDEDISSHYYIFPATLAEQQRWIGLPTDEAITVILTSLVGFAAGNFFAGIMLAALFWVSLKHFKSGQNSKWFLNFMYWHQPFIMFRMLYKTLPDSSYRLWVK